MSLVKALRYSLTAGLLIPTVTAGWAATVVSASFEVPEVSPWSVVRQDAYPVVSNSSFFAGSNLDGVAGQRFLLFGSGNERGKIRFIISTVPGKAYTLFYYCGATDTQRFPIGAGPGFKVTFTSLVQAYHGKKIVQDHLGMPLEIDDLENLNSRIHPFSTPGTWNWRIHEWLPVSYAFVAKSNTTWIEFDTSSTDGQASVGVLDQVLVTTEPFAEMFVSIAGPTLVFAGKLQESVDLFKWDDVSPQPQSPYLLDTEAGNRFFRVEK